MQLADLFDNSLHGQSDTTAIEYDTPGGNVASLTFGELAARSHRMAQLLRRRGLRTGDRLALHLPNRIEFIDLLLGCIRLGVIVVPINVLYRAREIAHIVSDAEPRAVVTARGTFQLFGREVTIWDVDDVSAAAAAEPLECVRVALEGTTAAALVYTSGTTGRSKGAVLSHDNVLANTANLIVCWRITAADRYLAVLPLFHVHGLANGLMTWLASGCRMRLVDRFEVARVVEHFRAFRPTLFFGVPTIYVRLLDLPVETAREIGLDMRLFVSGSAPLSAAVFDDFRQRFGHAILERYGMSETLMNISNPYTGERRPGSVGLPLPGVAVRIVGTDGREVADGEAGELLVRGPNVFSGYWRQPEATAAAFTGGWFRTGDVGERSHDGYYTLRGRRADLIISGGYNVYPREIEDVLLAAPGVREASVVGIGDRERGEVPVAYVVADAPVDPCALETHCREALAPFKVPRRFVQVAELPRTALGKVQKHLLEQRSTGDQEVAGDKEVRRSGDRNPERPWERGE